MRRTLAALVAAAAALWIGAAAGAAPRAPLPATARVADSLVLRSRSDPVARSAVAEWSRRATLHELAYLLRRDGAELGPLGPDLARRALDATPTSRAELRLRLAMRLLLLKPRDRDARRVVAEADPARLPHRPAASAYRVGVLAPLGGDYELYGRSVLLGVEAAVADFSRRFSVGVEVEGRDTQGDVPEAATAAADTLTVRCATMVGALLSTSTFAAAAFGRAIGFPLISPTAPDESVGKVGGLVFQVGPSGFQRGQRLARAALAERPKAKLAMLWSSAPEAQPVAGGFRAQAESLGATVVWEARFGPGTEDFRANIRALKRRQPDLLFWDGESREAERLLRQLVQEKVSLLVCGGASLDPQQLHGDVRPLVEGAMFVSEDWNLSVEWHQVLTKHLAALGGAPNRLHVRGFLAGRALAAALEQGALTPLEIAAALEKRVEREPYLAERGFLAWPEEHVGLAVMRVVSGQAVPAARR
jgi:branched-chain amino acid transport system substrate-binding protein